MSQPGTFGGNIVSSRYFNADVMGGPYGSRGIANRSAILAATNRRVSAVRHPDREEPKAMMRATDTSRRDALKVIAGAPLLPLATSLAGGATFLFTADTA